MYKFVNPYNFFPLTDEKKPAGKEEKNLTGVIHYTILTKTPLFIPNTSSDDAFDTKKLKDQNDTPMEHKSYDFFSYCNLQEKKNIGSGPFRPVIPGSEIRGMLRSYYEILTESCLSAYNENTVLSKRTEHVFDPGLLKREKGGRIDLYKTEDVIWRTKGKNSKEDERKWKTEYYNRKCYIQDDLPEGTRVYFEKEEQTAKGKLIRSLARSVSQAKGSCEASGYILKGEPGPEIQWSGENGKIPAQKHSCHIFCHPAGQNSRIKAGISLDKLDAVLAEYEANKVSLYSEYRKQLKRFRKGEGEEYFPVYYSKIPGDADDYFLSPASKTREVYRNQLKNMVKSFGSCESEDALCQSCSLFGTLRNEFTVASRIRFSDLQVQWEADSYEGLFEQVGTLRPLSSPKLNNMEFYMKRPDQAVFWTYDYYVDQYGNVHPFPEGSFPEIAGRKFYWHQMGEVSPYDSEKTSQNMTVRPVSPGVSFHGSLYFHKISQKELDQLIWLLNVGEKGDIEKREHGYKLGAAKPLGFGSIALAVDEVLIRKVCREMTEIQYKEDPYISQAEFGALFHEALAENFRKMTNFNSMKGKNVSYPKTKDGNEEGYQWFVENHKARKKKGGYTDSPRKREQMLFMEYMIPMEPELAVAFDENHIPASDKSESTSVECPFQEGKPYEACVVHVPKNGKILHIEVEGRKGYIKLNSAKLAKSYSEGQKIQVKFVTVKAYTDGGIGYYFS